MKETRPTKSDLAQLGYIDDSGMAPSIQPNALNLQIKLTKRPSKEALILHGIMPLSSNKLVPPLIPLSLTSSSSASIATMSSTARNIHNMSNIHASLPFRHVSLTDSDDTDDDQFNIDDSIAINPHPINLQRYNFRDLMII